jgi:Fe2+ or Zn2+ uptake regulation protein
VTCTRDLFATHNLRCTRQRQALYEVLRACKTHPTAEELYRMTQCDCAMTAAPAMSRATVYNTLEALCRAGLVRRLPTVGGCCRFDADTSEHLHVRFRDTQEIRDVPPHLGERLVSAMPRQTLATIEKTLGVRIDGVNIQLIVSRSEPG